MFLEFCFGFLFGVVLLLFFFLFVGFFSLLERKILGLSQLRLGPDFFGFKGIFQPLIDGLKLFLKSMGGSFFLLFPVFISWIFIVFEWVFLPTGPFGFFLIYGFLFSYGLSTFSIISYSLAIIFFYSRYPQISLYRVILHHFSLEGVNFLSLFPFFFLVFSLGFQTWEEIYFFFYLESPLFLFPFLLPYFFIILIINLGHSHRHPFDYAESESELVSGYLTEHGSTSFMGWSISEYTHVYLFVYWLISLFFPTLIFSFLFFFLCLFFFILIILFRSCFPRFAYYNTISFFWGHILFYCFFVLFFFLFLFLSFLF